MVQQDASDEVYLPSGAESCCVKVVEGNEEE
jgi:hypothetical protein